MSPMRPDPVPTAPLSHAPSPHAPSPLAVRFEDHVAILGLARVALATFLTGLALLLATVLAAEAIAAPTRAATDAPPDNALMLERGPDGEAAGARLVASRMASDVMGPLAETRLVQVFQNDGAAAAEALYLFPLPEDAALHAMTIRVGDRVIEGVVRERARARRIYETAKQAGHRAGLVEQQRPNLFTTRFANVPAGATVTVELAFQQSAARVGDAYELVLPQVVTRRYMPDPKVAVDMPEETLWRLLAGHVADASAIDIAQNPGVDDGAMRTGGHALDMVVRLRPGAALSEVSSPSHRLAVKPMEAGPDDGAARAYLLRFADGPVAATRDVVLRWRAETGAAPAAHVFVEERPDGVYLMGQILPPSDDSLIGEAAPRDVTFILDTSGSMHGESIAQATSALARAIEGLTPADRFDVIRFANDHSRLFGATRAANVENRRRALAMLARLEAEGGTEMRPALNAALSDPAAPGRLRQIVFLTDGAVGNEVELFADVARSLDEARLFTIGLGPAPNDWFLRKAAEFGRGAMLRIDDVSEAGRRMAAFYDRIGRPAWTELSLVTVGDPGAAIRYPGRLPDLYRGEPVTFALKLDRMPRALMLTGARGQRPFSLQVPAADFHPAPGIARHWGRQRIAALMDRLPLGAEEAAVREAVLRTALAHGLASRWTSFVAVERAAADGVPPADRAQTPDGDAAAPTADRMARLSVGGPATGLGDLTGPVAQGLGLIALGFVLLILLRRRTGAVA